MDADGFAARRMPDVCPWTAGCCGGSDIARDEGKDAEGGLTCARSSSASPEPS